MLLAIPIDKPNQTPEGMLLKISEFNIKASIKDLAGSINRIKGKVFCTESSSVNYQQPRESFPKRQHLYRYKLF